MLCYSRMLFFQIYPKVQRFACKVFLTEALKHMGGVPEQVIIDNTHVVVLRGTGSEMIPVPEMEAFAERFGFRFVAHERGDANRSAHVERPFSFIENNPRRARVHRLGRSQPAGTPVVRPRQLDLQEASACGSARAVRGRAPASEASGVVGSRKCTGCTGEPSMSKAMFRCLRSATRFRYAGSVAAWIRHSSALSCQSCHRARSSPAAKSQ